MKYVYRAIFGFLFGFSVSLVGLYYNPFTGGSGFVSGVSSRVFTYHSPFTEELAVTHGGWSRLPLRPATIAELWEDTIRVSLLSVLVLRDEQNAPVGIASRVSQFLDDTEMLVGGVLVGDDWLVTIPGEGSFFIEADSNLWPFMKETLIPVWYLDRSWEGPKIYRPTTGPGGGDTAIVTGATGNFAARKGTAAESYEVFDFSPAAGPGNIDARLYLNLPEKLTNLAAE